MTIGTIDRSTCRTISDKAEAALQTLATELGMTLSRETARYGSDFATVKFTFKVNAASGVAKTASRDAALLGLPDDIVGRKFVAGNTTYTVTDLKLRRPKFPVSGEGPHGGRYKFTVEQVLRGLLVNATTEKFKAGSFDATVVTRRTESAIMSDILDAYVGLSPENLTCDGEASAAHVRRTRTALNKTLKGLFAEIVREVSEDEAYKFARKAA